MRFEASYGFHAVIAILFLCFLHLAGQFFVLPLRIRSVHRRRAQRVISKVIIMDKRSVYEFVCVYVGCFMYLTLQRGGSWARNQAEAPFSFSPPCGLCRGRADEQFISQLFTVSLGPSGRRLRHAWLKPLMLTPTHTHTHTYV